MAEPDSDVTPEQRTSPVALDGCGSTAAAGIHLYRWTFADGEPSIESQSCHVTWQRPVSHSAVSLPVTLTIVPESGAEFSLTKTITFRDVVIASLGDSAASGEGAPDRPIGDHFRFWVSPRCDRSGWAASALAALRVQRDLPNTTVHLWHLACSGATIESDGSGDFNISHIDAGGLLDPYSSHHPDPSKPYLKPQLAGLNDTPARVDGRLVDLMDQSGLPVDRLLIQVGANDLGWATVLQRCFYTFGAGLFIPIPGAADHAEAVCLAGYTAKMRDAVRRLRRHFEDLATAVHHVIAGRPGRLQASSIYLTQYFDPLDSEGPQGPICGGEPVASRFLRQWGVAEVERPLQAAIQDAAGRNQWHFIGGIRHAFQGHGVCYLRGRWTNDIADSVLTQRDVDGTWHANVVGQQHMRDFIYDAIRPGLS